MRRHARRGALPLVYTLSFVVALLAASARPVAATADVTGPFVDVAAVAPDDVWAVTTTAPVRWNGTDWTEIPWATMLSPRYEAVAALPTGEVWAVGRVTRYDEWRGLIVSWDGAAWRHDRIPSFNGEVQLRDVDAFAPDDVWAVGYREVYPVVSGTVRSHTVVLRWDGLRWSKERAPDNVRLRAVAATGSRVWAVGDATDGRPVLLRRGPAGHWRTFRIPTPRGAGCWINDVAPHAIVGWCTDDLGRTIGYAATFGPRGVHPQTVGGRPRLEAVGVAGGRALAVGTADGAALWRRTADGSWRRAAFPTTEARRSALLGIDAVARDDVWAVGWRDARDHLLPLAVHWDGTTWTVMTP